MRKLFIVCILAGFLAGSCNQKKDSGAAGDPEVSEVSEEFSDMSIYNLPSHWTDQNGEDIELKDLRGKVTALVMIYTSCQSSCPRLVADMRNIEKQVPESKKEDVQYVFVSIDPEVDTPERMKDFAIENQMDDPKWIFLRGTEEDTREFAAVLAVNYKRISPVDFSHSNIISVFNQEGELVHQQEGLSVNNKATVQTIVDLAR